MREGCRDGKSGQTDADQTNMAGNLEKSY